MVKTLIRFPLTKPLPSRPQAAAPSFRDSKTNHATPPFSHEVRTAAAALLGKSPVAISVVGFPLGCATSAAKAFETKQVRGKRVG
jgi:hypothetical protein